MHPYAPCQKWLVLIGCSLKTKLPCILEGTETLELQELVLGHRTENCKDETQSVRVTCMAQRGGESSKQQFCFQKLQAQQPIPLSNIHVATSNMVFLNKGTAIQDAHSIQSPFK